MAITNRIVTRGFGPSRGLAGRAGPVTQGYGGLLFIILEAIRKRLRLGRSRPIDRRIDECDEFTIRASLVRVNRKVLVRPIAGTTKVVICPNPNLFVRATQRVRTAIIETIRTIFIKAGILRWKR